MSDKNLETVVVVEWGGGFTFIQFRDNPKRYAVEDTLPLNVGSIVNITKTGTIKISRNREKENFIQIKEMIIYDKKGRQTSYKAGNIDLIEYS